MRKMLGIMAACLVASAAPADAALVQLSISGTLQGTQSTIMCGPGSASTCLTTYSGGLLNESFNKEFGTALLPMNLVQGDNAFSYGAPRSGGMFTGTIRYDNGVLSGLNLFYSVESGDVSRGVIGSSFVNASARSFAVTAVPEPTTWALMLLGFLAVGSALRQVPKQTFVRAALR
jgi:hypothetical protein